MKDFLVCYQVIKCQFITKYVSRKGINRAGDVIINAGYGSSKKKKKFMPPHPLTNFEIQKYYQNEPKFNGFYSRDNLANEIKDDHV